MTKSAFRLPLVWALCLGASGLASAAPIAYVHELTGKLQLQYGKHAPQELKVGGTIESGATLTTGAGTNTVVKFEDGQVVALQPDTQFAVRGYQFVKTDATKSNVAFELLAGALRFATGMIGSTNRNAFRLTAGTATIGIRGTTGDVLISKTGEIHAAADAGTMSITTRAGESVIQANTFASVSSPNAAPTQAASISTASPAIAQVLSQVRASNLTSTLPASVGLAAKAAQEEKRSNDLKVAVEKAAPSEKAALQRAADLANAEANKAAQIASKASEALLVRAEKAGYVQPPPPAPAAPPPPPAAPPAPKPGATAPAPATPAATTTTTQPTTATSATPATPAATTTTTQPTTTTSAAPAAEAASAAAPAATTAATPPSAATQSTPATATTATQSSTATPATSTSAGDTTGTQPTTAASQPAATQDQQPVAQPVAQPVTQPVTQPATQAPTVTSTPSATSSGSGGGGTASVR